MVREQAVCLMLATVFVVGFSTPIWAGGSEGKIVLGEIDPLGCIWTEDVGEAVFKGTDTRDQVRLQAIADARRKNLNVLGVEIKSSLNTGQFESRNGSGIMAIESLRMVQKAIIVKEEIRSERLLDLDNCAGCKYQVRVKDCVKPRKEQYDKGFIVSIMLTGIGKDRDRARSTFLHGEDLGVMITVTRDAYIYLYNIDVSGRIARLYPKKGDPKNFLSVNEQLRLPTGKIVGQRYQASLEEGLPAAEEVMLVIASKHELPDAIADPDRMSPIVPSRQVTEEIQGGTFMTWMGRMSDSDEEWVDAHQFYDIRRQ